MTPTASKSKNPLSRKDRMEVPRQSMPEQPAEARAYNFEEVNLGFSPELALQEALRCLECAKPRCTDNCPVGIDVKDFVQKIVIADFLGAAAKIARLTYFRRSPGGYARRKISAKGSACSRRESSRSASDIWSVL